MALHHRIIHQVQKNKEQIMDHVNRHHTKYLVGAGIISGLTIAKFIILFVLFLGMAQSTRTGADYYDVVYKLQKVTGNINISNIANTTIQQY